MRSVLTAFLLLLLPAPLYAESFFSWNDGELSIVLEQITPDSQENQSYALTFSGDPISTVEPQVKELNGKVQLLLPDYRSAASGQFTVGGDTDPLVIDIAPQDNATSIMLSLPFDLKKTDKLQGRWEVSSHSLLLRRSSLEAAEEDVTQEETLEEIPMLLSAKWSPPVEEAIEEPVNEKDINEDDLLSDSDLVEEHQTEEDTTSSDEQKLVALRFEKGITLDFQQWPEWRLAQRSEDLFELSVQDCKIAKNTLLLTHFAPSTVPGITSVKPTISGDDTKIEIAVESGTTLTGNVKGTSLSLQAD